MEDNNHSTTNQSEIKCKNCAATLTFEPGTTSLKCPYCGAVNEIEIDKSKLDEATKEIDYLDFINNKVQQESLTEVHTVKCSACGAETTFDPNVVSAECAFCGTPIVVKQASSEKIITPKALIPFKISQKEGHKLFKDWLKRLWWAPNNLKKQARQNSKLVGVYTPYWTYDASTVTTYEGQRGDDYTEEEEYTNDEGETQTRTVVRTEWTYVSGTVYNKFDDVLVVASKSLPEKIVDRFEKWNLDELVPYDEKFLAGFRTETYQVDVQQGFETAKRIMDFEITDSIRKDIGGDHQRITKKHTTYNDITFKHILLPLWISAYRYNNKVYRFIINGQTGEVRGERPYSWIKITLAILVVLALIIIALYFANTGEGKGNPEEQYPQQTESTTGQETSYLNPCDFDFDKSEFSVTLEESILNNNQLAGINV